MSRTEILVLILGMAAATYVCRLLPFYLTSPKIRRIASADWVRYLPVAIVSAVVFPNLLLSSKEIVWGPVSLPLLAAVPAGLAGFFTRNLLFSVVAGVSSLALLRTL
ncbi:AzlD domain-containing protein [bacterium]|nr:AzlD domain-containing protein [bacterium]